MKILVTGFFGERNFGDEAILSAIIGNLAKKHRLTLTCGQYPSVSGPRFITRRGLSAWPEYIYSLTQNDRVILSGGILQDWSYEGITFFALRILAASIFNAEPSLWGAGLGPIRRLAAGRVAAKALSRVKTAWVRDLKSLELFSELTGRSCNYGSDWTWFFPVRQARQAFGNAPVGVNLRQWPDGEWQNAVESQQKHIDRHVVGLPARPSDRQVIKQFFHAATLAEPGSFYEAAELCDNLSFAIAMRFHIALLVLRAGLPSKLIAYDEKVASLAAEADITLLNQNHVADFRVAAPGFIAANEARFAAMQAAFKEYFK